MGKMSYGEQLRHPNWQRKRLEILQRCEWMCMHCMAKDLTLHVHHRRYIKGRMAWEYDGADLVALCEDCHAEEHERADELGAVVGLLGTDSVLSLVAGLAASDGIADAYTLNFSDYPMFKGGVLLSLLRLASADQFNRVFTFALRTLAVEDHQVTRDWYDRLKFDAGINASADEASRSAIDAANVAMKAMVDARKNTDNTQ